MEEKEGPTMCMATHPMKPNHDGHAKGRKSHLTLDGKKTLCNMLVDNSSKPFYIELKSKCKICNK